MTVFDERFLKNVAKDARFLLSFPFGGFAKGIPLRDPTFRENPVTLAPRGDQQDFDPFLRNAIGYGARQFQIGHRLARLSSPIPKLISTRLLNFDRPDLMQKTFLMVSSSFGTAFLPQVYGEKRVTIKKCV